jgi:pantothenate kinase
VRIPIDVRQDGSSEYLIPLSLFLAREGMKARERKRRFLLGITAGPGAGKTVLSQLLQRLVSALLATTTESGEGNGCVSLSFDGYHFPNAYLASHTTVTDSGEEVSLARVKGSPPTFDAEKLSHDLQVLRNLSSPASLPIYDRDLHEPVEGEIKVKAGSSPVVVVEGLFLLRDSPPTYASLRSHVDMMVMLLVPVDLARDRLIERKLNTGRTRHAAEEAFERVDRINHVKAELEEQVNAHLVLHLRSPGNRLSSLTLRKGLLK